MLTSEADRFNVDFTGLSTSDTGTGLSFSGVDVGMLLWLLELFSDGTCSSSLIGGGALFVT